MSVSRRSTARNGRDRGSILPLTLVVTVAMSTIMISLLSYTATNLRYGNVVEDRADRLSAAEAGLRHVLEKIQINGLLCTTNAGNGAGIDIAIPDTISDANVSVNCSKANGTLSNITSWAVVVTAEGMPAAEKAYVTSSGNGTTKVFGGPSYVADLSRMGVGAALEIRDGDLWTTDSSCTKGGQYSSNGSSIANLSFSPATRGVWCTSDDWTDLYKEPAVPTTPSAAPAPQTFGTCKVFFPGLYTSPPAFDTNNYMRSGDYFFDNVGNVAVNKATVTAGRQGVAGDLQAIKNDACDSYRDSPITSPQYDPPEGATFYMDGNSRFTMQVQGSLEILRRQHSQFVAGQFYSDFVSVHALPTSTLDWQTPILGTAPGNKKELAVHGQVWAPRASIEFGGVTNTAVAQFSGGMVVAKFAASASASVSGFVIQVQGSPYSDKFIFTATADKNGITRVRVVAQLRFSAPPTGNGVGTWELAMNSWRVCGATC